MLKATIVIMLSFIVCTSSNTIFAQTTNTKKYYFEVNGINNKAAMQSFQTMIMSKTNVKSLVGYGMPRSFYVIETTVPITSSTLQSWSPQGVVIKSFSVNTLSHEELSLRVIKIYEKEININTFKINTKL